MIFNYKVKMYKNNNYLIIKNYFMIYDYINLIFIN